MSKYAEGTSVPIGRSRDEIEHTLGRFGATGQLWARDDEAHKVTIGFKWHEALYKFMVALPDASEFTLTPTGRSRPLGSAADVRDQETRRRFRSLANYIKALLDATETGIIKMEEALMPYQVLPGGQTVYEHLRPQLLEGHAPSLTHALMSGREHE